MVHFILFFVLVRECNELQKFGRGGEKVESNQARETVKPRIPLPGTV
jgi:hypothetical protein